MSADDWEIGNGLVRVELPRVWLAWQNVWDEPDYDPDVIEMAGVFSSVEKAKAACVEYGDAISGPFEVDKAFPRESVPHPPSAYWPDFEWVTEDDR